MSMKLINLIFGCNHPERHHSALPFTQDGKSYQRLPELRNADRFQPRRLPIHHSRLSATQTPA